MNSVNMSLPRDTEHQQRQQQPDEPLSILFNSAQLLKVSALEKNLRTHLTLLSNPSERIDIRFIFDEVREKLEDEIIQSVAEICYLLADPKVIEKYQIQLKIRRRWGFDGRGIPTRKRRINL